MLAAAGATMSLETEAKLSALAAIETGGRDEVIGTRGELSRYQIMPSVWKKHFAKQQCKLHIPAEAKRCAYVHVLYLEYKFMEANGNRKPSAAQLYAMWNLGLSGFRRRGWLTSNCPAVVRERAERFANIYTDYTHSQ
jgi:hypothetical protein